MSTVLESDLVSYDPLSEVTRKERRALLGVSLLGLALVKVPLVPTKLSALGVEFADLNQKTFVVLYSLVVVYFLLAFLIYGLTDLVAWSRIEKIRYSAYKKAEEANTPPPKYKLPSAYGINVTFKNKEVPQHFAGDNPVYRGIASFRVAMLASRLRAIFEFAVPIGFASYVLVEMYLYVP